MNTRIARGLASFLVPPLIVVILLYQVLASLQVGFTRPETLRVAALALGAAAAAGAVAVVGGVWARTGVFALSTVLLLDAALHLPDAFGRLPFIDASAGVLPHVAALLTLTAVLAFSFWRLRQHIHAILLVFLVVAFAATVVTQPWPNLSARNAAGVGPLVESWQSAGPFDDALPIRLHIVFDEMMSPGAMSDDLPGAAETRRALYDLSERHRLRTHDSVYARDFFTGNSIPFLVSDDYRSQARLYGVPEEEKTTDNAYFADLAARGYRTIVFQTSHLDFCSSPSVVACETFNSFDPGDGDDGLDLRSRTLELWRTVLRAYEPSYTATYGAHLLGSSDAGQRRAGGDRFDVQRFPDWFDRFLGFVERAPRGTHVFAHFMVPHAPYLLTSDCDVSGSAGEGYYLGAQQVSEADRERVRLEFYADYLAQVNCVRRQMDRLLQTLERLERYRDAAIIIHGDHGSRISIGNLVEDYSSRDFIDNYATYFAVKAPDVEPGIDCEFLSLPEVFRRYLNPPSVVRSEQRAPLPVVVSSRERDGGMVEAAMPRFGCAVSRR